MKGLSIICCLLTMALMVGQTHAQLGAKPKYAADVPESIKPPDTVETEQENKGVMSCFLQAEENCNRSGR